MPVMTKLPPTENLLCQVDFSPIGINLQWPAVDDQSGCLGRAHPRMGGVAQQESGNTSYQCPCPTGANALGTADADTAHISFMICVGQRANVVHSITVAILAQGTSWAVAVTHAFLGLGSSPQASVRTLPAHAQAIFATAWTLARPRLWDRSPTGRPPSDHIHIHVGLASSSPPIHMPKGFLPMSGMPSESMGFPSSAG
jgi:hypothetical protein